MSSNDNTNNVAIKVEHIGKTFQPQSSSQTIKEGFVGLGRKLSGKKEPLHHKGEYTALKDISFNINKGDFFGIVGRNGSGKSTLLKIISGVYTPTKGTVQVNGKLTPFIELGVGFNPELSGRDNVFLNGALLGFSREEVEEMYEDIVNFSELQNFMDTKLKNYSSGMQVRLAFSIAIRTNTEILVLDEVLAVGDEAFQKKCYEYFAKLKKDKKTVILVTHSMDSVQQFCTKAIMIENGEVIASGNPAKVAQKYRELFLPELRAKDKKSDNKNNNQPIFVSAQIDKQPNLIQISTDIVPRIDLDDAIVSIFLDRDTGEQVYRFSSDERIGGVFHFKKDQKIKININIQNIFPNGIFSLRVSIKSKDRSKEYALYGDLDRFEIDRRIGSATSWDIHWQPKEVFNVEGYNAPVKTS